MPTQKPHTPKTGHLSNNQLEQFDTEFNKFISDKSQYSRLFKFIRRKLLQFRLDGEYEPSLILNECYLRSRRAIESGQSIHNLSAWMRSVSFNVIREYSRISRKCASLQAAEMIAVESTPEVEFSTDYLIVLHMFHQLNSTEQELIRLRVIEEYSWEEIHEILMRRHEEDISPNTLRQRHYRALKKLREAYFSSKD